MATPSRQDIHLIARHSNWRKDDVERTLHREVYADRRAWHKFFEYFLLGAGAAFLLSGIFFFFAYNWEALHRFLKIGIVTFLFTVTALFGVFAPVRTVTRQVAMTAAVVLIGAVFAVLGQIYQTGANAFDFFLAWTLFALPWVAVVHFAPLWLLFVGLVNVCFITYSQQYGIELTYLVTGMLLFAINLLCWLVIYGLFRNRRPFRWLLQLVALWSATVATVNISAGAFDDRPLQLLVTMVFAGAVYAGWVVLSLRERSIFYLAVVGGSTLITITFLILRWVDEEAGFLLGGIVLLSGMTFLANRLNRQNKTWRDA